MSSTAVQILFNLIPIVGIACAAIVIFFGLLWKHRENKLRIMKGTYEPTRINARVFCLLTGVLLSAVGTVLTVMFALIAGKSYALLGGLLPLVVGLSLLGFNWLIPSDKDEKKE